MPQRWERELQRLNDVSAPAAIGRKVEEGPAGDGLPPDPGRRQRITAGVVAVVVFVAALAFVLPALRGHSSTIVPQRPTPGEVVFTFFVTGDPDPQNPSATMTADGRTVDGNGGSFQWSFEGGSMNADTFGTELDFKEWYEVPAGAPISTEGSADTITGWVDSCCDTSSQPPHMRAFDLENGDVLPSETGRYVLEFTATWPQGARTFYFPVEVVTPSPTPGVTTEPSGEGVAVFLVNRDPLRVTLTWGDQVETGSIDKTWTPTSDPNDSVPVEATDFIFFSDPIVLPPDTLLRVEGDLNGWSLFPQHGDEMRSPVQSGPVVLTLRGWWSQLSFDASFGLIVAEPGATVPVPDVVGLGDQQSIQALSAAGLDWDLVFRDVPGDQWKAATSDPAPGTPVAPGSRVVVTIVSRVAPLPAGATDPLACTADEQVVFGSPHMVTTPAGAAFIANVGGIRTADNVTHVGPDSTFDGLWHIVRDGAVIAVVDYGNLDGVACAGSGIAGA